MQTKLSYRRGSDREVRSPGEEEDRTMMRIGVAMWHVPITDYVDIIRSVTCPLGPAVDEN